MLLNFRLAPKTDAGGYSLGGATTPQCTPCTAGFFCVNGTKFPCPAGFLSNPGSGQCTVPCPAGNYCPGQAYPILCPPSTYSKGGASYNCTTCEPGHYCPTVYDHVFCPINQWSSPGQITSCDLACPTGVICPGNGKMECTICAAGLFTVKSCSTLGDTVCNNTCHPGMFGAFYTNSRCVDCAPGTYMDEYGATACRSCNPGHYVNVSGSLSCPLCPEGSSTSPSSGYTKCKTVHIITPSGEILNFGLNFNFQCLAAFSSISVHPPASYLST